jgi:hypothetical protein
LIAAIAKNNPRLIAVDIATSAGVFQKMNVPTVETKIVWARGARQSAVNTQREAGVASTVHPPPDDYVFVPEKVLGRVEPNNLLTGIALMPLDDDSHIRHFRREYFTTGMEGTSTPLKKMDSFHWAVVRKHCELTGADQRCEELFRPHADEAEHGGGELILNLAVDPYAFEVPIKASRVLTEANTGSVTEGSPVYHLLKDKIVLLGGKYEAARDSYPTSLGEKYGVDLNAIAIESELSGTGIRRAGHVTLVVLEVAAGLFLVGLNVLFPSGWKHIIALATIPLLALCGSFIAFSTLALWANFIPTLVATQIHFLYDKLAELKHLERETLELKRQLRSYEQNDQSESPDSTEQLEDDSNPAEKSAGEPGKPESATTVDVENSETK